MSTSTERALAEQFWAGAWDFVNRGRDFVCNLIGLTISLRLTSLRDHLLDVAARRRLSGSTVQCYWRWIDQFLRFCRCGGPWRHPRELAEREVEAFLTDLARQRQLSASSQNQAVNALVFVYRHALGWRRICSCWRRGEPEASSVRDAVAAMLTAIDVPKCPTQEEITSKKWDMGDRG